jgi:hypothetical protein
VIDNWATVYGLEGSFDLISIDAGVDNPSVRLRDVYLMLTHISMTDSSPIHSARIEMGPGPSPEQAQYSTI